MADLDDNGDKPARKRSGGKVATLTLVLAILNIIAAIGFGYLALLDYQKRQEWTFAVFMHDLIRQGLPFEQDATMLPAWQVTVPKEKLTSEQIKEVFSKRGGSGGGEFAPVNDVVASRIKPQYLTKDVLDALFSGLGPSVKTVEEEIARLKTQVLADITDAADKTEKAAASTVAKRQKINELLLPLAYTAEQVDALSAKVNANGTDLDALLKEAVQRNLIMQVLTPLQGFRPGSLDVAVVEKAADVGQLKLDRLRDILERRFDEAKSPTYDPEVHQGKEWENQQRDSFERRTYAAFLLLAVSQMQLDGTPLYSQGFDRSTVVAGLLEMNKAIPEFVRVLDAEQAKVIAAINRDRQGYSVTTTTGQVAEIPGFAGTHKKDIQRLQEVTLLIHKLDDRLSTLREQQAESKKHYEDRVEQLQKATAKLDTARAETNRLITELRSLQAELFAAQRDLADAPEENMRLEAQLRKEEQGAQK